MATTSEAGGVGTSAGGWHIGWGVLLIVCGIVAILMPEIAALATALIFAWLLILGGVFEIAYAFQTRTREGFGWKIASGILTLVLGNFARGHVVAGDGCSSTACFRWHSRS